MIARRGNVTAERNATTSFLTEEEELRRKFKKIQEVMSIVILVVIMTAMGCGNNWKQIWKHLRRPVGVAIGMFSQFIVMPLVGFTLLKIMALEGMYAIGVLIISCSPGGAVSNIFAYFLNGDLPLSVTMTTLSTLLALGFMPLNLFLYGMVIETGELYIPYKNMAQSLAYVTSPCLLGMLIKWKQPKIAFYITKIGSVAGFLMIAVAITLQNLAYPDLLFGVPWKLYVTVVVMPIVGLTLGFSVAWLCRRDMGVRKTIAVECGIQNVAIALAVISLSKFSFETQKTLLLFPTLYGISMILLCFVICSVYQLYLRFCGSEEKEETTITEKPPKEKSVAVIPMSFLQKPMDSIDSTKNGTSNAGFQ